MQYGGAGDCIDGAVITRGEQLEQQLPVRVPALAGGQYLDAGVPELRRTRFVGTVSGGDQQAPRPVRFQCRHRYVEAAAQDEDVRL